MRGALALQERQFSALYVHVPFCRRKCGYCAFYSMVRHDSALRTLYLRHLEAEFAASASLCGELQSVFVGGGTPSILSVAELQRLLGSIRKHFGLAEGCEFTVECNPESLTFEKIQLLREIGVNRISVGVQSLHSKKRRRLMRAGTPERIEARLDCAARNFDNVSVDLIFGAPDETAAQWAADLQAVLKRGIPHLSTYALTLHENTRLAATAAKLPDDQWSVAFWEMSEVQGRAHGLYRYEVSNLARPGYECRHNMAVWHGAPYLGCGPAAASFNGVDRWSNVPDLDAWLAGEPPTVDRLDPPRRAAEILAFGLRTVRGWTTEEFEKLCGLTPLQLRTERLERLAANGLIRIGPAEIRPTAKGLLFADTIVEELI